MKKIRYLALTDHSGHSKENSLYALMRTLSQHENTRSVQVASRGDARNNDFFSELKNEDLFVADADENFDFQENGKQFLESETTVNVKDVDVVLMRLPRPVSDDFLYFLEDVAKDAVIINSPHGIRLTSTKQYLLNFPELAPPMKLVRSKEEIQDFAAQFSIVLKPLKEYGGKGIVKIKNNKVDTGAGEMSLNNYLSIINIELQREGYLAMKYLENVRLGDKRILVVDGQIMASSLRLPAEESWLCNVAQGGKSVPSEADDNERNIIATIAPRLKAEGILIFGADTLTDDDGTRVLSEINTLSIGGFPQAEKQTGLPVLQNTINAIAKYALENK